MLRSVMRILLSLFILSLSSCTCDEAAAPKNLAPRVTINSAPKPCIIEENGSEIRNFNGPVFAIGDLHGDLEQTYKVLRLVGAIDAANKWIGTCMIVVQTGDQVDRGDDDRAVLDVLRDLSMDAKKHDSRLILLNGNHELLNAALDFRYTTKNANDKFREFKDYKPLENRQIATLDGILKAEDVIANAELEHFAHRAAAFVPGRLYARRLAERSFYAVVNDTVFVHGGITAEHVRYGLEKLNSEMRDYLLKGVSASNMLMGQKGPFWIRDFSAPPNKEPSELRCQELTQGLNALDVKRMVVGHTIQEKINPACGGKVWRIDVGMSKAYGERPVQALEIRGGTQSILQEHMAVQ